jgi:hypothetical protein
VPPSALRPPPSAGAGLGEGGSRSEAGNAAAREGRGGDKGGRGGGRSCLACHAVCHCAAAAWGVAVVCVPMPLPMPLATAGESGALEQSQWRRQGTHTAPLKPRLRVVPVALCPPVLLSPLAPWPVASRRPCLGRAEHSSEGNDPLLSAEADSLFGSLIVRLKWAQCAVGESLSPLVPRCPVPASRPLAVSCLAAPAPRSNPSVLTNPWYFVLLCLTGILLRSEVVRRNSNRRHRRQPQTRARMAIPHPCKRLSCPRFCFPRTVHGRERAQKAETQVCSASSFMHRS